MARHRSRSAVGALGGLSLLAAVLYLVCSPRYKPRPLGDIRMCRESPDHKKLNFTVVTALFDIGRGNWRTQARPFPEYLDYFRQLLSLDVNLVIFLDPKAVHFVRKLRMACPDRTVIIPTPLESLEWYKFRPRMEAIMSSEKFKAGNELLDNAEGHSAEYNIVMNSKYYLLNNVTFLNPFNSSHFMWIDSGYGHGLDIGYPKNGVWEPRAFLETQQKVTVIQMQDPRKFQNLKNIYKLDMTPAFIGGFFGGDSGAIRELFGIYRDLLLEAMADGWVDDDQTFLLQSYYKRPDLFNPLKGEYWSLFQLFP